VRQPTWLDGRGAEIWKEVLGFAYWLTRADSYVLAAWCDREAEYENPRKRAKWRAADRREHTSMASELGLTSSGRTRLAVKDPAASMRNIDQTTRKDAPGGKATGTAQAPKDPAAKYLN
jgi:phage terminase small subunit